MSDQSYNLELPEDMDLTELEDMDLSSQHWQDRIANFMKEVESEYTPGQLGHRDNEVPTNEHSAVPDLSDVPSTGQTTDEDQSDLDSTSDPDIMYAIVMVRVDDELVHFGRRLYQTDYVHVSGPGIYANIPETNSAEDVGIDTIMPTDDEEEIEHWRLIPCSAVIQYRQYWASFSCKLQEYIGEPRDFVRAEGAEHNVLQCEIKSAGTDDNRNNLLQAEMTVRKGVGIEKFEFWCKRIVGDEEPELTRSEGRYVSDEEQRAIV